MGQNFSTSISGLGGNQSALNVAAAGLVGAAGKRTLFRIVVQVAPTAGDLTVNDLAANSGAAIGNQLLDVAFGDLKKGQVITLECPCANGIVVSSVGTGGVYALFYS